MRCLKPIRIKTKPVIVIIVAIAIIVILLLLAATRQPEVSEQKPTAKTAIAVQEMRQTKDTQTLNNLQVKLNQIAQQLESSNNNQALNQLQNQIAKLSQDIAAINNNSEQLQKTSQENAKNLQQKYQALAVQIKDLSAQVAKLNKKLTPAKYLPSTILPFKVIGIDYWNNQPMVSIAMRDTSGVTHYRLISQDMKAGGWRLKYLNPHSRTAIFVNSKNKKVKAEL